MRNRYLIIILILFNIGYGSVWALDSFCDVNAFTDYQVDSDASMDISCNHSCHGASHLLGLWQSAAIPGPLFKHHFKLANPESITPFFLDPPEYPPRLTS